MLSSSTISPVSSDTLPVESPKPFRTSWSVLPFVLVHLACVAVFFVPFQWPYVALCLALYYGRMFFVTAGYHRYFSHRTFHTSRVAQFLFAVAGNSAVQRGPLWWASHHRHHHVHSDRPGDASARAIVRLHPDLGPDFLFWHSSLI